eukprot:gene1709-3310_t
MEDVDWYGLLGCSIHSSNDDISKATRKLSLKYHPDKNPDPKAQDMFILLQKAKDFLLDDTKRKEYDDTIRKTMKRKEYDSQRNKNMNDKRKKMRDELETRMKNANIPVSLSKEEEEKFRRKQQADAVERLRRENQSRMETSTYEAQQKAQKTEEFLNHRKQMSHDSAGIINNQIKVKWRKSKQSHSDDSLYRLFGVYGSIEDVSFTGDKGSTAIITYSNEISAKSAVDAYETSEDYRVSFINESSIKKASIFTHEYTDDYMKSDSDLKSHVQRAVEKEELLRKFASRKSIPTAIPSSEKSPSASTNTTTSTISTQPKDTTHNTPVLDSNTLAKRENDILSRMLEAAAMKKKKQQEESIQQTAQTV